VLEGVDCRDVRVIEGSEDLGLAFESGQAFGVGCHGLGQDLDCDLSAERGVFGAVNLAHPSFTQFAGDSEVRESHTF
jgi:hypothetical protein